MPKAGMTYGPRIAPPDYAKILKDAQNEVLEQLGPIVRPDVLIVQAADIVRQADAEIALHVDDRNDATASLWFYEQRMTLAKTIGVTITAYREILSKALFGDACKRLPTFDTAEEQKAFAKEHGVRHIPDAAEKVLEPARIVAAARARRKAAVRFMQDATLALSEEPYGWDPEKIADHAGVQRHLVYKHRNAARKRQGL